MNRNILMALRQVKRYLEVNVSIYQFSLRYCCLVKQIDILTMMRKTAKSVESDSKACLLLGSLLLGMAAKRKSYCFQLIKQFYLFPDESESSRHTVSKYDALIFSDEQLHTLFRKLETKLIQRKIWGFINLKSLPYIRAAAKMEKPIKRLKKRIDYQNVVASFKYIKSFANTKKTTPVERPRMAESTSFTRIRITHTYSKGKQIQTQPKRTNNHITNSEYRRFEEGSRSRSGSITRFSYDVENGSRILLNGEIIPCRISVKRSESPLREPEYIKITKTKEECEDIRYKGLTKNELEKRESRKLEYNTPTVGRTTERERSKTRIIYVERSSQFSQVQIVCPHCSSSHSGNCISSQKKIKRLRSSSKKHQSYLTHLQA